MWYACVWGGRERDGEKDNEWGINWFILRSWLTGVWRLSDPEFAG